MVTIMVIIRDLLSTLSGAVYYFKTETERAKERKAKLTSTDVDD